MRELQQNSTFLNQTKSFCSLSSEILPFDFARLQLEMFDNIVKIMSTSIKLFDWMQMLHCSHFLETWLLVLFISSNIAQAWWKETIPLLTSHRKQWLWLWSLFTFERLVLLLSLEMSQSALAKDVGWYFYFKVENILKKTFHEELGDSWAVRASWSAKINTKY